MLKWDFNKVALQLYWKHTSAWLFSCRFAADFQNTFGCFWYFHFLPLSSAEIPIWRFFSIDGDWNIQFKRQYKVSFVYVFDYFFTIKFNMSNLLNNCFKLLISVTSCIIDKSELESILQVQVSNNRKIWLSKIFLQTSFYPSPYLYFMRYGVFWKKKAISFYSVFFRN